MEAAEASGYTVLIPKRSGRPADVFNEPDQGSTGYFESIVRPTRAVAFGEQVLLYAVLANAINELVLSMRRRRTVAKRVRGTLNLKKIRRADAAIARQKANEQRSLDWMSSRDCRWPFSFQSICDWLCLNTEGLRRAVLESWQHDDIDKMQILSDIANDLYNQARGGVLYDI